MSGSPGLDLEIGDDVRRAVHDRTIDGTRLIYAYTVQAADRAPNGFQIGRSGATLNPVDIGGTITDASGAPVQASTAGVLAGSAHKVDGSTALATGGICGRSGAVVEEIIDRIDDAAVDSCDDVTAAQLAEITTIRLQNASLVSLAAGDFGGLDKLEDLQITRNGSLRSLPAGLLDGLGALVTLQLQNNALAALPADLLSGKPALEVFLTSITTR